MTLEEYRCFYAEEIQFSANVSGTSLLEAFVRVPREDFLGPGPWKIAAIDLGLGGTSYIETPDADPRHVYHNVSVALDASRDLNNGQPAALAKWIEALNLKTGDHVYHLGCGTGYYTAIMARIVGSSGRVLASEVDTDLAVQARNNLAAYSNVSLESGDGTTVDP